MSSFQIRSPGGQQYKVDAPDGQSALEAVREYLSNRIEPTPSDPYLASPMRAQPPGPSQGDNTWGGTLSDVAHTIPSALGKGSVAIAGFPGDLESLGQHVGNWFNTKIMGNQARSEEDMAKSRVFADSGEMINRYETATGTPFYNPKTNAGQWTEAALEPVPGALVGGGSTGLVRQGVRGAVREAARSAVKFGVIPGVVSEAAGRATKGSDYETAARVAGGVLGAGLPAVARRVVTPNVIRGERLPALQTLEAEGVGPITEGQATGKQSRLFAESQIGGARGREIKELQGESFTQAALRRAGITANRATPEVIDDAFTRLGNQFNALSARNNVVVDPQLLTDVGDATHAYNRLVNAPNRAPLVRDYETEILNAIGSGGAIPGDVYQSLRSRIGADMRGVRDPNVSHALHDMQDALDNAMERSIQASNPADIGAWQNVRRQYRNLLVIEQGATGAGSSTAMGVISPSQLRGATVNMQGRRAYARGRGDFAQLARAGEAIMKPVPDSGTPARLASMNSIAAAISAGPRAVQRLRMTSPGINYLTNRIWPKGPPNKVAAIIAALLNEGVYSNPSEERR